MLDFLKKKNITNRPQATSKLSNLGADNSSSSNGKSFIFQYCEKLQKLDSEFEFTVSKLNDTTKNLKSLQDEIKVRHPKISSLTTVYESTKNIISVFDEYKHQICAKGNEYSQICVQISDKLSANSNTFETPSKDLILKESSLNEIDTSCNDFKIKFEQMNNEIQIILVDINSEKKIISDQEITKNSLKDTLSQLQEESENFSSEIAMIQSKLQQMKDYFDDIKKQEEANNQQMANMQKLISDADNNIKKLDLEITTSKHSIEEKSYAKLNTHKETLDFERSSIPIRQNLIEITDKYSKIKSLIEQTRVEEQKIANELEMLTRNIQECKLMNTENEVKQQNEVMMEARLKGESQANSYRLSEAEKSSYQIENEYKIAKDELDHLKTNEIELKSTFVSKMGEAQHLYSNEDTQIRQLTLDINEIKVKIDMIKSKQNANKQLEEHIKKNEEEMSAISSQNRVESNEDDSSRQSIIPTILKLKKNKSRFLEID